ncbi:MAG: hypothetical protein H6R10_1052 [Rhodocyclaceae bacterium]|nr:hypothetical protein [Rhodocyclaceae bacterium]
MGGFSSLFSLQGTHEFFSGAACPAFDFVPTPACRRLVANGEVLLRREGARLAAYYDTDRAGALPDTAHFDFLAYCRDSDFHNYTDAPLMDAGRMLYFDSADADDGGRLSRNEYVSAADLRPESEIPDEFRQRGMPALFLVRIAAGARDLAGRAYFVPFRTRRTAWQYYVSGKGVVGTDLYVAAPGGEEEFDYQGDVGLPNGRQASLYRSRTLLPLLNDQPVHYALRERFNGRLVVRKLPVPSTSSLARETAEGGEVPTSRIFVNL